MCRVLNSEPFEHRQVEHKYIVPDTKFIAINIFNPLKSNCFLSSNTTRSSNNEN